MRVRPLSEGLGCEIERRHNPELPALAPAEIVGLLKEYGVILFTGFENSLAEFEVFTETFGQTVWGAHDVFPGGEPLGFHGEATWTPCPPDIVWFYCVTPATSGGETTLCDGVEALARMSPPTRELFRRKRLQFNKYWTHEKWLTRLNVGGLREAEVFLSRLPRVSFNVCDDETLHLQYVTPAIVKTKLSGEDAFVNSVINSAYYSSFGLRFEDGSEIPAAVREELRQLTDSLALALDWEAGEFVMIDNSRVMHGRNAYIDTARDIKSIHTNLSASLLAIER